MGKRLPTYTQGYTDGLLQALFICRKWSKSGDAASEIANCIAEFIKAEKTEKKKIEEKK